MELHFKNKPHFNTLIKSGSQNSDVLIELTSGLMCDSFALVLRSRFCREKDPKVCIVLKRVVKAGRRLEMFLFRDKSLCCSCLLWNAGRKAMHSKHQSCHHNDILAM